MNERGEYGLNSGYPSAPVDVESGIECTLSKFDNTTKLCGAVNTLDGRDAIQKDLDRLERWAPEIFMKFHKAKCKVLHVGQRNPKHKYRLGGEWIESSPEEDLGVLVDKKFNVSKVHSQPERPTLSWAALKELWPGQGRWFCPPTQTIL
ncbi:rna-directed dna polymerase from mobile element jockey-like [Limosa lapponica baueri]|uniref:Rna-directed dna polymerase from mobile element jockey-like n=1 Tax=Limosa lapponica baueri TaxID=1758121 RepID=A0A2I0UCT4_LIMLA|nr:rna-directed dna polymerase from mobile element jockey-like [Limosa lapponica baueri]